MPEFIYDCQELRPGVPEPYPIKLIEDNRCLMKLSPNDALEMAKNLIELVDSHHEIKPIANKPKPVRDAYAGGRCPDCGYKIPKGAQPGDHCPNCEHVWWQEREDDDGLRHRDANSARGSGTEEARVETRRPTR